MKTSNRATVDELSPDQMQELAQSYLCDHYAEYNPEAAAANEYPSWGELADAMEIVGRETLANEYAATAFSPDDFSSTAGQPERPARYWYAVFCPQGIHAPSARDTLYRYASARQRAKDIERVNRQNDAAALMQAVTRAFAQKRFPRAFARDVIVWRPWSDGDRHFCAPIWRDDESGTYEFTGQPRNVTMERYEIRQVDAIAYDDGWSYNETWRLGSFETTAQDIPRAFRRALARLGIRFYRGRTRTEYDGSAYEIIDRKTGAPLFVAIPTD